MNETQRQWQLHCADSYRRATVGVPDYVLDGPSAVPGITLRSFLLWWADALEDAAVGK